MKHELPQLPYEKDQLSPFLSQEALEIHYEKHHRGYVNKLNKALEEQQEFQDLSLEELIRDTPENSSIFNFASQIWNHTFFWNSMAPQADRKSECSGVLKEAVERDFKSVTAMLDTFIETGMGRFGSGWVWLVKNPDDSLAICSTSNAESVLRDDRKPLLICDVWEHAYYVDYRNERKKFLEKFIDYINWEFVEKNFDESQGAYTL